MLAFFEATLNEITSLTKDCIRAIELLENKKSHAHKLIQTKLAFSFEQTVTVAKLAHESLRERTDGNSHYLIILRCCTQSAHEVLSNSNIQVIRLCPFEVKFSASFMIFLFCTYIHGRFKPSDCKC